MSSARIRRVVRFLARSLRLARVSVLSASAVLLGPASLLSPALLLSASAAFLLPASADALSSPMPAWTQSGPTPPLPSDQPFASYWFPNDLLQWSPDTDRNAPYNRSHTPLRDRFLGNIQINSHARPNEARISPLSIFWATSGNPSQGSLDADYYACSYWQYMDVLVFWGGSAGEGIILAPNPGIIDAAHRNGVPVLGTIFFPPAAYGGNIQWVRDLVQRNGSTFPVADKLIEAATYYGFDGYFINQETGGGDSALAGEVIAFMKYYQEHSDLKIMWYDAMIESGGIAWQSQLNSLNDGFFQDQSGLVSEYMFLDFGWSANDLQISRTNARALGRSEFDLYAGVDVQANGYNTYVNWNAIFPEGLPHVTSLGLYVPSWTYHSSTGLPDFYDRDNHFWVGPNHDPSNTNTSQTWKGLAHYVPDRSPINDDPFVTNFCTGQGYDFYVDGVKKSPADWSANGWNNLGLQDLLPTWRWVVESTGAKLTPEFDWSDAWYGGNCLKISGALTADNHVKLYKTDLPVSFTTRSRITFKTGRVGPTSMKLGLALASNPQVFVYHDVGATTTAGWNEREIDLSAHQGDRIDAVSLYFTGDQGLGYEMKIGQLAVESVPPTPPASPTELAIESRVDEANYVTLRLRWSHSIDPVLHYDVYRRNPDQSRTYLGGTPNNAYYVHEVPHVVGDYRVVIEVESVGPDFARSQPDTTSFLWDAPPLPAANPDPTDAASGIVRNVRLAWQAGNKAESHDVYFGASSPPAFRGNQAGVSFDPGDLAASTPYFWQIDERNQVGVTPGTLWTFTTGAAFSDTSASALDFDGNNDFVDCGNGGALQVSGLEITLEARIYARAWKPNVWEGSILNKEQNGPDNGYMLRAGSSGRLSFNLGSGSWNEIISPAGLMTTGTWYHVAGTYDGSTMRLYIDGTQVASAARAFSIAASTVNLYLGDSQSNPTRVFDGTIDEVRLWNKARSGNQIRLVMDRELTPIYYQSSDSGLVAYWRLNDATGQTAADLTPAGNHGRLGVSTGGDASDPTWVAVQGFPSGLPEIDAPGGGRHEFALHPNQPNPFRPQTTISFDLPTEADVTLRIFDLTGREVRTLLAGRQTAGPHSVVWDGHDGSGRPAAGGLYLCRIFDRGRSASRKLVLLP